MEIKTLIMAILITVVALFALTALFIWLGSKLEDQFAKQRNRDKELFDLEQQLGTPSSMRWHNSKPDIHEEIQNTLAERQRIVDELNK
jgi:hypothetical protein